MTIYFFAHCEIDSESRVFKRAGTPVAIQPLVFDLLLFFVQNPNRLLSKVELLDAAWRSATISESVVARAVMKARQAIQPESRKIGLIKTVARKGYVFSGGVISEHRRDQPARASVLTTPNAFAFAILPVCLKPQILAQPWMPIGFAALLQFLLTDAMGWICAPLEDVIAVNKPGEIHDEPLGRTCRLVGARETIQCTLDQIGGSLVLSVERGNGEQPTLEIVMKGGDCIKLIRQLAAHLSGKVWNPDLDASDQSMQFEALANALHTECLGTPMKALEHLRSHDLWLSKFVGFHFLKAKLFEQMGQTGEARQCFDRASTLADAAEKNTICVAIGIARAGLEFRAAEMGAAIYFCERALAQAVRIVDSKATVVEALIVRSDAEYHFGTAQESIEFAERAIAMAIIAGSLVLQARARLQLASILNRVEQYDRVKGVTDAAVEVARQCEMPSLALEAARISVLTWLTCRDFEQMGNAAERYVALAEKSGIEDAIHRANLYLLCALILAHRLDEATFHPYADLGTSEVTPLCKPMLLMFQSDLAWLKGDARLAAARQLQAQRAIVQLKLGQEWMWSSIAQCAVYFAQIGEFKKAEAEVTLLLQSGCNAEMLALATACLSVGKDDPNHAVAILRRCWNPSPRLNDDGMDVRFNLGWLLLENPLAERPSELDTIAAALVDFAPNSTLSNLFFSAYMLQRSPSVHTAARWDKALLNAPTFCRRCPWVTTESYRHGLSIGQVTQRLPLLLSYLC